MKRLGMFGLAVGLALPRSAHAGDQQWQLSLAAAFSVVDFDARSPSGLAGALRVSYGFNDAFSVMATFVASAPPAPADPPRRLPEGTLGVFGGYAGLRYVFDLLRVVPYVQGGLGVLAARGAGSDS